MATIAHPTSGDFRRHAATSSARAALERAVDAAPSRIPPPRGWLRRLFARDRSARAIIERYRLWPEIEYAYESITRELGPARVAMTAEDDFGEPYVAIDCYVQPGDEEAHLDFEETLRGELRRRRARDARRLSVLIYPDSRLTGAEA